MKRNNVNHDSNTTSETERLMINQSENERGPLIKIPTIAISDGNSTQISLNVTQTEDERQPQQQRKSTIVNNNQLKPIPPIDESDVGFQREQRRKVANFSRLYFLWRMFGFCQSAGTNVIWCWIHPILPMCFCVCLSVLAFFYFEPFPFGWMPINLLTTAYLINVGCVVGFFLSAFACSVVILQTPNLYGLLSLIPHGDQNRIFGRHLAGVVSSGFLCAIASIGVEFLFEMSNLKVTLSYLTGRLIWFVGMLVGCTAAVGALDLIFLTSHCFMHCYDTICKQVDVMKGSEDMDLVISRFHRVTMLLNQFSTTVEDFLIACITFSFVSFILSVFLFREWNVLQMGGIVLMILMMTILFVIAKVTSAANAVSVEACRTFGKLVPSKENVPKWTAFFQYLQLAKETQQATFSVRGIVVSGALVQTLLQISIICVSTVVPLLIAWDETHPNGVKK
jgi:hypothetical protein